MEEKLDFSSARSRYNRNEDKYEANSQLCAWRECRRSPTGEFQDAFDVLGTPYWRHREKNVIVYSKPKLYNAEDVHYAKQQREKSSHFFKAMEKNLLNRFQQQQQPAAIASDIEDAKLTALCTGEDSVYSSFSLHAPRYRWKMWSPRGTPTFGSRAKTISSFDLLQEARLPDSSAASGVLHLMPILAQELNGGKRVVETIKSSSADRQETCARATVPDSNTLKRRNSTGTLYITTTMAKQNNKAMICCVCAVIKAHILQSHAAQNECSSEFALFFDAARKSTISPSKKAHSSKGLNSIAEDVAGWAIGTSQLDSTSSSSSSSSLSTAYRSPCAHAGRVSPREPDPNTPKSPEPAVAPKGTLRLELPKDAIPIPRLNDMVSFFECLFYTAQLEAECIIISLIYCERLVRETQGRFFIQYNNWRSVIFASLMLASKFWDDLCMSNADFGQILPGFNLALVNGLELLVLNTLQFGVKVPPAQYAKYYFILRGVVEQLGLSPSPLSGRDSRAPLDLARARALGIVCDPVMPTSGSSSSSSSSDRKAPQAKRKPNNNNTFTKSKSTACFLGDGLGSTHTKVAQRVDLDRILRGSVHTDADGALHTFASQRAAAGSKVALKNV